MSFDQVAFWKNEVARRKEQWQWDDLVIMGKVNLMTGQWPEIKDLLPPEETEPTLDSDMVYFDGFEPFTVADIMGISGWCPKKILNNLCSDMERLKEAAKHYKFSLPDGFEERLEKLISHIKK